MRYLSAILLTAMLAANPVAARENDYSVVKRINDEVASLVGQQNFTELDQMANRFLITEERTPSGIWCLRKFHDALDVAIVGARDDDAHWAKIDTMFDRWIKEFPLSPTPRISKAHARFQRGWLFRGDGYVSTVLPDNMRKFDQHVEESRQLLEAEKQIASSDPAWYVLMIKIATAQSWSRDRMMAVLEEGSDREPLYYSIYDSAIVASLPKWGGDARQIEEVARIALAKTRAVDGFANYARIYWTVAYWDYKDIFSQTFVDWPTMKRGLRDIAIAYPDPWNHNNLARLGCIAQDRPFTAEMLREAIKSPDHSAWNKDWKFMDRCMIWALDQSYFDKRR